MEVTSDSETTLTLDDRKHQYFVQHADFLEQLDSFGRHQLDVFRLPQHVKVRVFKSRNIGFLLLLLDSE